MKWDAPSDAERMYARTTMPVRSQLEDYEIGHRMWRVMKQDNSIWLNSQTWDVRWPKAEPLIGINVNSNEKGITGEGPGIYAFKEKVRALTHCHPFVDVVYGQVALWGPMHVHEHGFRARYAYPLSVSIPQPTKDEEIIDYGYFAYMWEPPVAKFTSEEFAEIVQVVADEYGIEFEE